MRIYARYDVDPVVHEVVFDPKKDRGAVSMTNQADKDSTDINKIVSRFEKTGNIMDLMGNSRQPMYGDFTAVGDYHSLRCKLAQVDRSFMALPVDVRARFDNDPQMLIDFLGDAKNFKEAVDLGLMDSSVLLTALADDGVTRISPEARALIDADKASKGAAGVAPAAGAGNGSV